MDELSSFIEEELGALLRAAREDLGMTRQQAAETLGVTEADIRKIEMHSGTVTLGMLEKYAKVLGKRVQLKFL